MWWNTWERGLHLHMHLDFSAIQRRSCRCVGMPWHRAFCVLLTAQCPLYFLQPILPILPIASIPNVPWFSSETYLLTFLNRLKLGARVIERKCRPVNPFQVINEKQVEIKWKLLKCGSGKGWRKSVGRTRSQIGKFYIWFKRIENIKHDS